MTATPSARRSFNPRARKGRDSRGRPSRCSSRCFNPRARKGRDTSLSKYTASPTCFNPRARKGRDPQEDDARAPHLGVSIHAPARGATGARRGCEEGAPRFNPRARKGRDSWRGDVTAIRVVSIHAPARGATHGMRRGRGGARVSIHAPARGATAFDLVKNEKAQGKNIIALRPQSIYLEK